MYCIDSVLVPILHIGCSEPYKVEHAVLEPGKNTVDSVRRYTCLPGYFATGHITTTCAVPPKGKLPDWSTPVHYCKGINYKFCIEIANCCILSFAKHFKGI